MNKGFNNNILLIIKHLRPSDINNTFFDEQRLQETNDELKTVMDYYSDKFKNKETVFCMELLRKLNIIHFKAKRTHLCEAGRKSLAVDETGKYFACQSEDYALVGVKSNE